MRPLVLFYTGFFRRPVRPKWHHLFPWRWTADRDLLPRADVVVFHIPDIAPEAIAVLPKRPGQCWVAWSKECVVHFPQLADPAFMQRFDLEMTYRRAADIWVPYLPTARQWRRARLAPVAAKTAAAPVAMFQSSTLDRSGRTAYATELARYIAIDSYGTVMNNKTLPDGDRGTATKTATIGAYRFCIAFENARAPDYVTEKLFQPLFAGAVPIYLGAPNVDAFVPDPDCYINVDAHAGPEALAAYLRRLIDNPAEYERFHAWRSRPLPPALAQMIAQLGINHLTRMRRAARDLFAVRR